MPPIDILLRLTFHVKSPFITIPPDAPPPTIQMPTRDIVTLERHRTAHGEDVTRVTVLRTVVVNDVVIGALRLWPALSETFLIWLESLPADQRLGSHSPWERLSAEEQGALTAVSRPLAVDGFALVRVIRWRLGVAPHPRAITQMEYTWKRPTDDGWLSWPNRTHVQMSIVQIPLLRDLARTEVARLLDAGEDEPFAHELLGEAQMSAESANQRAAVLMAVTAMEVAAKTYAATCDPANEWLMNREWTPPLPQLIGEYVPRLAPVSEGAARMGRPGRPIRRILQAAVELRNSVAHVGGRRLDDGKSTLVVAAAAALWATPPWTAPDTPVAQAALEAVLKLANDVVWAFDYWSGNDWAAERISGAFAASWEIGGLGRTTIGP